MPQAAARRTVPACHPVLRAPSVPAHYQLRQRVESNIVTGACQARLLEVPPDGCVSPDLSKMALWGPDAKVHIWDVPNQQLLHRWDIPREPSPRLLGWPLWGWDPGPGQLLGIPCGDVLNQGLLSGGPA